MLPSILPGAYKLSAIDHLHNTTSMFLIIDIVALIDATIGISEHSLPMHLVSLPFTLILATISPVVQAQTLNVIVLKATYVGCLISPCELALTLFAPTNIGTFVAGPILPSFNALSLLLVVLPRSRVHLAFVVSVLSNAIGHIISPHAFIDISISMDKSA